MRRWFTADLHFGHSEIIKYCNRPFELCRDMDKTLIKNWNELVADEDIVYVLGDFSMRRGDNGFVKSRLSQLKGTKVLILGNHDYLKPFDFVDAGFQSVHTYLYLNGMGINKDIGVHLIHDPAVSVVKQQEPWLVGHVHNLFKIHKNCFNVGVDVNNFKPVPEDDIMLLRWLKKHENGNHEEEAKQ